LFWQLCFLLLFSVLTSEEQIACKEKETTKVATGRIFYKSLILIVLNY
jgi:hypothetical protein